MRKLFDGVRPNRTLLSAIAGTWLLLMSAGGIAADAGRLATKLDAPLRVFAERPDTAFKLYPDRVQFEQGLEKSTATAKLSITIRLVDGANRESSIAALRAAGADVRSQIGSIVTADVSARALGTLADLDTVLMMELSRPTPLRLNASVPATGAPTLRTGTAPAWSGITGKGVIVGIIDDGVDFRHGDFRNADGSSRLLALWDQRASGAAGSPPAGYNYGGECTHAMLDAAIAGNPGCTQPSTGGHGTHVAGIAAGNGQGTGNAQTAYRFVGMAPEADILAANSIAGGIGGSNPVLDAIAWMKAKAAAAGKPLVINLSLGSYFGARDGTSNFEVGLSSAGAPGVVVVAAAGNEGNAPIRAQAPISQGGQVVFDVSVPSGQTGVRMEAWYPGTDAYSVTIQGPGQSCPAIGPFPPELPEGGGETACGLVGVVNAGPFATNDDRQVQAIMRNGTSPLAAGAWRITFIGTQVAKAGTLVSVVTAEDITGMTITAINGQPFTGVTTQILTDTASAKRVIGVGAYNTNYNWTTVTGAASSGTPEHGPVNDLSMFSSRGPRRLCSNPAKCPQIMKPEITAPGAMIMAALAKDKKASAGDSDTTERDGVHIAYNGTSMATPHVAGAVALLLQKKPTLTPEEVKQLLFANAKKTTFTPAVPTFTGADVPAAPNYDWGYGVLDVAKAAGAIATTSAAIVTAFEFLYQPENRYFLTIDPGEATAIDNGAAGAGWKRTWFTFNAYSTAGNAPTGAVPVCRFYGSVTPGPNSHFFTASTAECQSLKDLQATTPITLPRWNYEGTAFRINEPDLAKNCVTGLLPVYRAYNNGFSRGISSNHRFSTSQAQIQAMVAQGWANEGAVFCSPQ